MTVIAGVLLLVFQLGAAAQTGRIEGIVVQSTGDGPIAIAGVELMSITSGKAITAATTSDGHFRFENLDAGDYRIAATHVGYIRAEYGQRSIYGDGLPISLEPGKSITNITLSLLQSSAIAGRIYNQSGAPAANVEVQILRYTYKDGARVLSQVRKMRTNDLGEYRFFWIPPDQYYLTATALPGGAFDPVGTSAGMRPAAGTLIALPGDEGMAPFYFPGSTDPKRALPIDLKPGVTVTGIDMRISPLTTYIVRGFQNTRLSSANVESSIPPGFGQVSLRRVDSENKLVDGPPSLWGFSDEKSGAFEIRGVLPGRYMISAPGSINGVNVWGRTFFEVTDADVNDVRIDRIPDFNLQVFVSLDTPIPNGIQKPPYMDALKIRLLFGGGGYGTAVAAQPSGSFVFEKVQIGDYRIAVDALPNDAYVKSVRMGNIDVLKDGLHLIRATDQAIDIVIGTNAGSVDGVILDVRGEPEPMARVVIVPEPPRRTLLNLYRTTQTDKSGRFRITGMPPGDYTVFAWEDVPDTAWLDADFLRPYEDRGSLIHIDDNGQQTLRIPVIPAGR